MFAFLRRTKPAQRTICRRASSSRPWLEVREDRTLPSVSLIDFDSLLGSTPISGQGLSNYLVQFGVTLQYVRTPHTSGAAIVSVSDTIAPSSIPNYLLFDTIPQITTVSPDDPYSDSAIGVFSFSTPLASFTFTRPALNVVSDP